MADNWWDELLTRLFAPTPGGVGYKGISAGTGQQVGKQMAPAFKGVRTELDRQEQAANGTPTPSPTPTSTAAQQQQANPNLREDEQARSAALGAVGTVTKANPLYGNLPNGKVYMGNKNVQRGQNIVRSPVLEDLSEVIAQVNDWTPKKIKKFNDLAIDAGFLKQPTKNLDELEQIWSSLALRSAKMWQRGIGTTPWSLLERYGKAGGVDGSNGPITTTTVNKSINLTSPREADALVDAALQQRLGRSPTSKEKKAFLGALNSSEKKEPTITKSTTTTSGSGTENVSNSTSTNTSGGVDVGAFAREWSMDHNKDEAGSYQALAQYMPAFYGALGAPV